MEKTPPEPGAKEPIYERTRCRVLLLLLNDLFTAAFVLAGCLWIYHLMGAYYTP